MRHSTQFACILFHFCLHFKVHILPSGETKLMQYFRNSIIFCRLFLFTKMGLRRSAFPSKFNQNVISNHSVLRSISCRISFQEAHFLPSFAQSLLSYSAIPSKFSAFPPHKTSETLICTRFSMAVNKAIINKKINKALSSA